LRSSQAASQSYLQIFNDAPRPFAWTKPADDIIASVASFVNEIQDGTRNLDTKGSSWR
jgi:hypothetical protein